MPLLIGKKGANIRLISMLLAAADIDVKTPEEAKAEKISYKTLEVKSMRERKFTFTLPLLLGILASFITGVIVIKFLLDYLKKGSFKVFATYRVIFGAIILAIYFIR